jgi:hypothetical protein
MDKMTIVLDEFQNEHALVEHEDGSFSSMPKAEYDRRQAEQSTPNLSDEA